MTITEGKGQEKGGIEGLKSPLGLRWGMDTTILALEAVIIAILLYSMHVLQQKLGAKAMGQMQQFQPDLLNQEQIDTD